MCGTKKQFNTFRLDRIMPKVPVRLDEPFNQYFWVVRIFKNILFSPYWGLWVSTVQDFCTYHKNLSSYHNANHNCGSCRFF